MVPWNVFPFFLLTVLVQSKHIPVSEINYFFENGEAPPDAGMEFPIFLTSSVIIEINPATRVLETEELTSFGNSLQLFYQEIFDSQDGYSLHVRKVRVTNQDLDPLDETLSLETAVDVNFRPQSKEQTMSNSEFHQILINLVNRFESELVEYLRAQHDLLKQIQAVHATSPDNHDPKISTVSDGGDRGPRFYLFLSLGCFVLFSGFLLGYQLHKEKPGFTVEKLRNLLPLRHGSAKGTDAMKEPGVGSMKYSWKPHDPDKDVQFPDPLLDGKILEDKIDNVAELWAPAGKLGIAMDVGEDGQPYVIRVKGGSPLEGFLHPGDKIVGIDEISTKHMSPADVTSVMVRRMRERRKITYVRGELC